MRSLDDTDREILSLLRMSPQETNKVLAEKLSLSEVTIAARIRAMESDGVMKVMAQRDFRAIGHQILANVDITVSGRSSRSVAHDITRIPGVAVVSTLLGDPSITMLVMAADLSALHRLVSEEIARVKGVHSTETMIFVDVVKYRSEFADFQRRD